MTEDPSKEVKKVTKKRQPRKEKKLLDKDEKLRRAIASITHKKTAVSCNWQSFIAGKKQNNSVSDSAIEELKITGFQKALARKKRNMPVPESLPSKPEINPEDNTTIPTTSEAKPSLKSPDYIKNGAKLTKQVAIDCEMVGVNDDGRENMLARVSLVNKYGDCIYDKFVIPKEEVVDYRTFVSGVRPENLANGETFEIVNKEVGEILKGRILVGHALRNDLKVLHLPHPRKNIRDTAKYPKFRQFSGGRMPGLKKLAEEILGIKIQEGEHDSVIDARATMQIYMMYRKEWEEGRRWHPKKNLSQD